MVVQVDRMMVVWIICGYILINYSILSQLYNTIVTEWDSLLECIWYAVMDDTEEWAMRCNMQLLSMQKYTWFIVWTFKWYWYHLNFYKINHVYFCILKWMQTTINPSVTTLNIKCAPSIHTWRLALGIGTNKKNVKGVWKGMRSVLIVIVSRRRQRRAVTMRTLCRQ